MFNMSLSMKEKKKILFVCLGNICRSSSAEGVMRHLIEEAGREDEFVIDSAGILSYHQGELPDSRMRAHAARRGYNLTHRSRPVRTDDFYEFDLIIGMDDRNIDDLKERAPSVEACGKIHRMTEYCTKFAHADYVPDPYYGGAEGFEYSIYWKTPVPDCLERLANNHRSMPVVMIKTLVVVEAARCIHSGLLQPFGNLIQLLP